MATQDGLNRYNGTSFEVFRDEPFDTSSISSNNTDNLICNSKDLGGNSQSWVKSLYSGERGLSTFFVGSG